MYVMLARGGLFFEILSIFYVTGKLIIFLTNWNCTEKKKLKSM